MSESVAPKVRFAPSPTGMLHVGGVRTALYNWLFARRHGGTFVLRIEDTDRSRHVEDAVRVICDGLSWLGLDWDEGPLFQSERLESYRRFAEELEEKGLAYRSDKGAAEKGEALVFRSPGKAVRFEDLVKGTMEKAGEDISDFVIMRSNGFPTYNFACVVDDVEMGITHVIRGDDHVENTFRQILVYEALGKEPPAFAHLPMIHNEQGQKLSKRDGAVAVTDYQEEGYLPEAVVNYLALLGWSPGDDREIMSVEELVAEFDLGRVRKSASRFDFGKFRWVNSEWIKRKGDEDLAEAVRPFLERAGLEVSSGEYLARVAALYRERLEVLSEFPAKADFFFSSGYEYEEKGWRKFVEKEPGPAVLQAALERLQRVEFTEGALEKELRGLQEEFQVGFGRIAQPLRMAVSGRTATPGIFETLAVLGKEETLSRIRRTLEKMGG